MRSRDWLMWILAAGLFLAVLLIAILAWQFRAQYERQLIRKVWPAGSSAPVTIAAMGGGTTPTTLLLGDSRIAQWSLTRPSAGRIVNAGIGGATTAEIADTARDLIEKFRPDVVVIEAGINDLKLIGMRPDMQSRIVDEAYENLTRLVNLCLSFRCKVIVLQVWPASKPEWLRRPVWNAAAISTAVVELNQRLMFLHAPEKGVLVSDLLVEAGGHPAYRDTLHLQPETYDRLTPVLDRKIEQLRSMPRTLQ